MYCMIYGVSEGIKHTNIKVNKYTLMLKNGRKEKITHPTKGTTS